MTPSLDRRDYIIALLIGLFALVIYTRVLAPDILYSDSGEFQTLAYTGGITHTTGYPVYLILARIVGLIPVNSPAWRINFVSALSAAVALGGLYLLARHVSGRGGAVVAAIVLLLSYTFWSQAIIAEVYTPATAFIVVILLILLAWQRQPIKRKWWLFGVGFLLTLGLGVHLFLVLIAPAICLFVLWGFVLGQPDERWHIGHFVRLFAGMAAGFIAFFGLFALYDAIPTPASVYHTSIYPSRDAWGLQDSDVDTIFERFWLSFSGVQWRDAMLPAKANYEKTLSDFLDDYLPQEFSKPALLLAAAGAIAALIWYRRRLALFGAGLGVAFAAGVLYQPGDQYIFYLPAYVMLSIFVGAGAGYIISRLVKLVPARIPRAIPEIVLTLILLIMCVSPFITTRWKSFQIGKSPFISADYVYPVNQLAEPRRVAECALSKTPEPDAVLVLDWRALYSIYYLADVEGVHPGIVIYEARPHGTTVVTKNLLAIITAALENGQPVYTDMEHPPLRQNFTLTPVNGCLSYAMFKLGLKE